MKKNFNLTLLMYVLYSIYVCTHIRCINMRSEKEKKDNTEIKNAYRFQTNIYVHIYIILLEIYIIYIYVHRFVHWFVQLKCQSLNDHTLRHGLVAAVAVVAAGWLPYLVHQNQKKKQKVRVRMRSILFVVFYCFCLISTFLL